VCIGIVNIDKEEEADTNKVYSIQGCVTHMEQRFCICSRRQECESETIGLKEEAHRTVFTHHMASNRLFIRLGGESERMVLQLNAKRLRELPLFSFASLHVCIFYPVTYYLDRRPMT